jgi:hypothetical protein
LRRISTCEPLVTTLAGIRALDKSKAALAHRMHASGEPVPTIAATLGVSRATVYRVLAVETTD